MNLRSAVPAVGVALLLALPARAAAGAPCVRLTRAGTQVQGDVRVCPGRYRIADPTEHAAAISTPCSVGSAIR